MRQPDDPGVEPLSTKSDRAAHHVLAWLAVGFPLALVVSWVVIHLVR